MTHDDGLIYVKDKPFFGRVKEQNDLRAALQATISCKAIGVFLIPVLYRQNRKV